MSWSELPLGRRTLTMDISAKTNHLKIWDTTGNNGSMFWKLRLQYVLTGNPSLQMNGTCQDMSRKTLAITHANLIQCWIQTSQLNQTNMLRKWSENQANHRTDYKRVTWGKPPLETMVEFPGVRSPTFFRPVVQESTVATGGSTNQCHEKVTSDGDSWRMMRILSFSIPLTPKKRARPIQNSQWICRPGTSYPTCVSIEGVWSCGQWLCPNHMAQKNMSSVKQIPVSFYL